MSTTGKRYEILELKGPISVVPVTPEDVRGEDLLVYLLMGPTGSGKSAFIESLCPDQKLRISKDSLESVTQEVVCYRTINLTFGRTTVLLVDTPGFLDIKLSESRITVKIRDALDKLRQSTRRIAVSIYYFQPITEIRLGGSKRDAVKLLRAFAESFGSAGIVVITTMWNHIPTAKQIDGANCRFTCLKNEIFETSDKLGIDVVKFDFSLDSALSILDRGWTGWQHDINESRIMDPQYQSLTLNNLVDRITNTQLQLHSLVEDKWKATTPGREDSSLLEVVLRDEKAALSALQSFLDDLVAIGPTGLTALESLLDACYDTNPSSSSSPWPHPSNTTSLAPLHSLPPASSILPAIQNQGPSSLHVIHSSPGPRSSASTSHQPELPPSPSPSQSHNSPKSRLKDAVTPFKGLFKKLKK